MCISGQLQENMFCYDTYHFTVDCNQNKRASILARSAGKTCFSRSNTHVDKTFAGAWPGTAPCFVSLDKSMAEAIDSPSYWVQTLTYGYTRALRNQIEYNRENNNLETSPKHCILVSYLLEALFSNSCYQPNVLLPRWSLWGFSWKTPLWLMCQNTLIIFRSFRLHLYLWSSSLTLVSNYWCFWNKTLANVTKQTDLL